MKIQTLQAGRQGAIQTLQEMKRLTLQAIHSQRPRTCAVELIRDWGAMSPEDFVRALKNWILMHITLLDEFEELLIGPEQMLDTIAACGVAYGDCDDVAMLACSILASVGAQTRLTAVFPVEDGSFAHVVCEYKFPRREHWEYFDGTIGYRIPAFPAEQLSVDIIS